jgi:hypothetical protein
MGINSTECTRHKNHSVELVMHLGAQLSHLSKEKQHATTQHGQHGKVRSSV